MDPQRSERRKKRQKRRQLVRKLWLGGLIIGGVVLLAVLAFLVATLIPPVDQEPEPINPEEETLISLAFAGDLNITDKVVEAGASDAGYDYKNVFQDILPLLADADNTVVNFEGNLVGEPYGSANTSAPPQLLEALSDAGVDMLQVANSCTINNGLIGLTDTLDAIRAAGIEPLGAYATAEEFQRTRGFTLRDIQGIKVAFVAFTKGMDGISLPEGQEDNVNLLYTDYTSTYQKIDTEGITHVLQNIEDEKPDITIALLHWGSEYNSQVSSSQTRIVKLLKSQGVDAIIGTHSHYVQEIDFDEETNTLVAYSLGDLLGDADRIASSYSAVLKLQVAKNRQTGTTRIAGFEYEPIYNFTQETESGVSTRLLRIRQAMAEYEANGMTPITREVYDAMGRANNRIDQLFTPKPKETEE